MGRESFTEIVTKLEKIINTFISERNENGKDTDTWLQSLYTGYMERMRADNQNIWTTGAIFLPLSLSAFAALVTIDTPEIWKTSVLAFGSLVLIWVWLFIAENHRSFQQKSEAWLVAIQKKIGLNDTTPRKARGNKFNTLLTFNAAIQIMRWVVAFLVSLAWLILLVYQFINLQKTACCV